MEQQFFVIELQHRPEGIINQVITAKNTRTSALSYYYERKSKMLMTTLYTRVAVMVTDSNLTVIEQDAFDTLYQAEAAE